MDKKLSIYLQDDLEPTYHNTEEENKLMARVYQLYSLAKAAAEHSQEMNPDNLEQQRRAYYGTLKALDRITKKESKNEGKQIRKLVFEMVESKVETAIPLPKITAHCKSLLPVIERTEEMLRFEVDRLLSEENNDMSERNTYIDGTTWYKVGWDPRDIAFDKAGNVCVNILPIDTVIPQPGVSDYKRLEYLFERTSMSAAEIWQLYGRNMRSTRQITGVLGAQSSTPDRDNLETIDQINVVAFYFINEYNRVGRILFTEDTQLVIDSEPDWLVKKENVAAEGEKPKWVTMKEEVLTEDLYKMVNKYKVEDQDAQGNPKPEAAKKRIDENMQAGMSQEEAIKEAAPWKGEKFLEKGKKVPCYYIHQLPFIPRKNISRMNSLYGISDAAMLKDIQDELNKSLTRTGEKIQESGGILFKDSKLKIDSMKDVLKVVNMTDPTMAAGCKYMDINPQVQGDIQYVAMAYESGRSTIGITNSFQGKEDATATSGKAKEMSSLATAGRLEGPRVMKRAALAEVYRLMFMFKLAFSSAKVSYVKTLPEAQTVERTWDKYMFLDEDDDGNLFYHDEFAFSTDAAATLANDREGMWQETLQMFTMGTMGPATEPRNLLTFWGIMEQLQYPLAKYAIASIKESSQHIDPMTEQLLLQNPELMQLTMQIADEMGLLKGGQGGARANSGPTGNGMTHAANVAKTNGNNATKREGINRDIKEGAKAGGGA